MRGTALGDFLDRPDEAITAPRQRLDPVLAASLRKNTPDCNDLNGEVAFLDDDTGPHGIDDVLLGNVFVRPFDECAEHGNRSPAERRRNAAAHEDARLGLEAERPDFEDPRHGIDVALSIARSFIDF